MLRCRLAAKNAVVSASATATTASGSTGLTMGAGRRVLYNAAASAMITRRSLHQQRQLPRVMMSTAMSPASSSSPSSSWRRSSGGMMMARTMMPRRTMASSSYPDHTELNMPALSPTMEQGNLTRWLKKEGDKVNAGDVLAEVETDKATVSWESVEDGYIARILIPEGTSDVPLGSLAAIMVDDEDDVAAFKDYKAAGGGGGGGGGSGGAPATQPEAAEPEPEPETPPAAAAAAAAPQRASKDGKVFVSPKARRLAFEKGIDVAQVAGTGPGGRIIAADILEFKGATTTTAAASPAKTGAKAASTPAAAAAKATPVSVPTPASADLYEDVPHTNMRKTIAKRLLQSKQTVPHYYLSADCRMDSLLALRKQLNEQSPDTIRLSVNDFIIKAAALALRKVPEANASWMDNATRYYKYVDVSVAVATDGGLITPIVKDADKKGLATISANVKALAEKARNNSLQPDEFIGGTFSVSNLGMFGVKQFSAVINPPQSVILAVGGTQKVVVPTDDPEKPFAVQQQMSVTISCDHRVVDGAVGAQWLAAFKGYIEQPTTMLL